MNFWSSEAVLYQFFVPTIAHHVPNSPDANQTSDQRGIRYTKFGVLNSEIAMSVIGDMDEFSIVQPPGLAFRTFSVLQLNASFGEEL